MGKLSYINPSNFESEEIEFPDNQIILASYIKKAIHMDGFMISGPIVNDDKDKLIIGAIEKGEPGSVREKYKITIEKI